MKIERIALCAALSALVLASASKCASTADVNTKADSTSGSSKGSSAEAKLGQPITISGNEDGARIQVTAAKIVNTVKSTDGVFSPDAGKRWVAVQFLIKNVGTVAYDDSPSNGAKVIDVQDQQYEAEIAVGDINAGPTLPAGVKLPHNGSARGYIVFSVPKSAKIVKVQFSEDSGFGQTAEWTI